MSVGRDVDSSDNSAREANNALILQSVLFYDKPCKRTPRSTMIDRILSVVTSITPERRLGRLGSS